MYLNDALLWALHVRVYYKSLKIVPGQRVIRYSSFISVQACNMVVLHVIHNVASCRYQL